MPPPPEYHTLSLADMSIGALQTEQCAALQQEEQEVMQAIYADRVSFKIRPPRGTHVQLRVSVDLAAPCQALIVSADGTTASSAQPAHTSLQENEAGCRSPLSAELTLSHLPPIILTLSLPPGYPLYEPAAILSLHATHSWITSTSIDKLWEIISDIAQEGLENGGEGVLWRMYELLRDGQVLSYLDLKIPHRTLRLRIPHPTPRLLYPLLLSYNTAAASQEFATQSYPCPICLMSVTGSKCIRLDKCGHICCRSCLSDFWTLTIQQGEIERVGCVDEACVKSSLKENFDDPLWASVGEEQIREVVGEVLLQRWIHLRDKRMVERDPTTVQCPNRICQAPVPKPPLTRDGSDEDYSNWDNLRSCQNCGLSFCLACRKTWHGPITPCTSLNSELLQSYLSAEPDSEERHRIERQYGKRLISRLVGEYEEGRRNEEWIEANTMCCPGCMTKVEKSVGCNHMKCVRCSAHFCFLCGYSLPAHNPYAHFSLRGTPCFGNLFSLDGTENEWQPILGFEPL